MLFDHVAAFLIVLAAAFYTVLHVERWCRREDFIEELQQWLADQEQNR